MVFRSTVWEDMVAVSSTMVATAVVWRALGFRSRQLPRDGIWIKMPTRCLYRSSALVRADV